MVAQTHVTSTYMGTIQMIGAIIKATFNICDQGGHKAGKASVIKTYTGQTKQDLDLIIKADAIKYGYIDIQPLTTEQYEQQKG